MSNLVYMEICKASMRTMTQQQVSCKTRKHLKGDHEVIKAYDYKGHRVFYLCRQYFNVTQIKIYQRFHRMIFEQFYLNRFFCAHTKRQNMATISKN